MTKMTNTSYMINRLRDIGVGPKTLCNAAADEIERLRDWVKTEGESRYICTHDILGDICEGCQCANNRNLNERRRDMSDLLNDANNHQRTPFERCSVCNWVMQDHERYGCVPGKCSGEHPPANKPGTKLDRTLFPEGSGWVITQSGVVVSEFYPRKEDAVDAAIHMGLGKKHQDSTYILKTVDFVKF